MWGEGDITFAHLRYGIVMALYLVGQHIDRHRAHARAQAGDMINLARGVYVDAEDDIDQTVLNHAVRIAAFLYPAAYLSAASAQRLTAGPDRKLFLSGRRNQRTRIRALEIVQNQAPPHPSTVPVLVGDDQGEMPLRASSPRQRFLEAFRVRSEHAVGIDYEMRSQMAQRLIEEFGGPGAAADQLWALARPNGWIREAEQAEQFLRNDLDGLRLPVNQAGLDLLAAWHGAVIGRLAHDGAEWRWTARDGALPQPVRETRPGSLPPFIEGLLPEGWLAEVLDDEDPRDLLRDGRRYMSNMTLAPTEEDLAALPADVLEGRLARFTDAGRFTGRYLGVGRQAIEESFQESLARLWANENTPRLSGVQIKAPMTLRRDGDLVPAINSAFTHILKPAGTGGFETLPMVEWICLQLAAAAAFEVPNNALVEMPEGMPPALLVERFDIRRTTDDGRRIAMEDFCSVLELPSSRKYDATIERAARPLRGLSTAPDQDRETLFLRALFAWLIADGDLHLKNLALLKVAQPDADRFDAVRMAPVYDAVTTRVFPNFQQDRMALDLAGKDDRLDPDDFRTLARTIELPLGRANMLMADCARRVVEGVRVLALPAAFATPEAVRAMDRISAIVSERAELFL